MPSRAPRRPASGSGPSLHIPSWHAVLSDPTGDSDKDIVSELRCRHGLRRLTNGRLGTAPDTPVIRSTRVSHFVASLVRASACHVARPPARRRIGQWLDLLLFAGLSPARMELASLHGQSATPAIATAMGELARRPDANDGPPGHAQSADVGRGIEPARFQQAQRPWLEEVCAENALVIPRCVPPSRRLFRQILKGAKPADLLCR
jgi:hypothetical protein